METIEQYKGTIDSIRAFGRFVDFWMSEETDPQPEFSVPRTTLVHSTPIPEELSEYWEVRSAWMPLPLAGRRKGVQLIGTPKYFVFDPPYSAIDRLPRELDDNPPETVFLKVAQDWCKCCFHGVREEDGSWAYMDYEDRRERRNAKESLEDFLIQFGLWISPTIGRARRISETCSTSNGTLPRCGSLDARPIGITKREDS